MEMKKLFYEIIFSANIFPYFEKKLLQINKDKKNNNLIIHLMAT